MEHPTTVELTDGLDQILGSPSDEGLLKLIVRRLAESEREVLIEATLDLTEGLVGDTWRSRGSRRTPDQLADPKMQLTVMNARVAALVAIETTAGSWRVISCMSISTSAKRTCHRAVGSWSAPR